MSKAANRAKTRWNAENYKQIKVSVDPYLAIAFQTACTAAGVSMARALSLYMAEYSDIMSNNPLPTETDLSTKRKRRRLLNELIGQLVRIRDAQEQAKDNIPENLQDAGTFESAEESIALMDEAIALLEGVY